VIPAEAPGEDDAAAGLAAELAAADELAGAALAPDVAAEPGLAGPVPDDSEALSLDIDVVGEEAPDDEEEFDEALYAEFDPEGASSASDELLEPPEGEPGIEIEVAEVASAGEDLAVESDELLGDLSLAHASHLEPDGEFEAPEPEYDDAFGDVEAEPDAVAVGEEPPAEAGTAPTPPADAESEPEPETPADGPATELDGLPESGMYTIVEETDAPAVSDLIADLLDESSTVEQVEQEASTRLLTADYVASNQDEVVDLTELLKEETKAVEAAEAVAAAQAAERARREAEAKAAAEAAARATAESEAATEKAGFFKRLFGRKKKS
jgi:hypothetical protein